MKIQPTNSFHVSPSEVISASLHFNGSGDKTRFEDAFARFCGARRAFIVESGTSALYFILMALKKYSSKTEVILPAYTVPTLTLAVKKAGLIPRLSEISLNTFNLDHEKLHERLTKNTLAVLPVHMFGFPMEMRKIQDLGKSRGFFVIEDAAQAIGATIGGKNVGGLTEAGIFSLCKGKILSSFRGGVITTNDPDIEKALVEELDSISPPGIFFNIRVFFTLLLLAGATNPTFYGALLPLISLFKSKTVHTRFTPQTATDFIARLGSFQLAHAQEQVEKRVENGMMLYRELSTVAGVRLPGIIPNAVPSFNHLPVMVEDEKMIGEITEALLERGIDTARMYRLPIHQIYDLGYPLRPDPFPMASRLARGLFILPTHPRMTKRDIQVIIDVMKDHLE